MRYLLDTNVCIEILRGRNVALKERLTQQMFADLSICAIVWAELQCGARLAQRPSATGHAYRSMTRPRDAMARFALPCSALAN